MAPRMLQNAARIGRELKRSIAFSTSISRLDRSTAEQPQPPQKFSESSAGDCSQDYLLLSGLPATALPSDILRLVSQDSYSDAVVDRTSGRAKVGDEQNLRRYVAKVRPLYQPTSLRSTGKYLVKVVHQSHRSKLEQHLSRKSLSARTIKVSRIQERDLRRLTTHNVVDITTPKGSMQVLYNIRPNDRPQISHFLNAVIASSSGRLVLLRGLPPGVVPSAIEARLSRAYALIEPVRCRVRCWNKDTEGWDGLEVHPIMRLYTAYRSAGPSQWRRGKDVDDDGCRIWNSDWTTDQNQLDIHLAHQDPDATAIFLVRLKTSEDALRLCRSFHRKIWDSVPRKALRSRVRATLRRRGGFGSELPNFEEAAEDDDEAAAEVEDGGEAVEDEGRRTERSEDQENWAAEYARVLAREAESRSNARRYVVEAQIMY